MKANWDGALDMHAHVIRFGGIVQDFASEVIASVCSSTLPYSTKPIITKAMALRRIMILCEEMGLPQL